MRNFVVLVVACASAFAGLAAAQTAPVPASASDIRPIARGSATEVLLDVVILDKHGKPVKNLKAGDVQVFEDDVKQSVTGFRYIAAPEAQQQQTSLAAAAKTSVPAAEQPGGSHALHSVNLIPIVFHNLDPVARIRAIDVVREFLKTDLPPDSYIGLFVLDDRLNPVIPFTRNKQEVSSAVGNAFTMRSLDFIQASEAALTASPTVASITTIVDNASHTATTNLQVNGGEVSSSSVAGAEVSTDIGANARRGGQIKEARDFSYVSGMRETDKIMNMITQFGKLPGRKMVLLLSTGFPTTGDPDRFQSMVTKATSNDVTVYSFDVSGNTENSSAHAGSLALNQVAAVSRTQSQIDNSMGSLSAAKEKSRQGDTMNDAVRNSDMQASLRALAEDTGGFLTANTNEYRKPFQHLVEDMETHYELTYRPASQLYNGHLRTIQVKVSHPDWRVESRTGYFAVPDLAEFATLFPQDIIGLAMLDSKPLPHAFDLHAAVFNFRPEDRNRKGELVLELPGDALTAAPVAGKGTAKLRSQMFALIKDASGQVVDKFSIDTPYEIPVDKLAGLKVTPLVYTYPFDLPMGNYTVDAVAMDREGGRASTASLKFDTSDHTPDHTPDHTQGIGMSSALLIRRIEPAAPGQNNADPLSLQGKRLVPFVETTLAAETKPYAYFVIYPRASNTEKPKVHVQFRVDGELLADTTTDATAPDASGAIPMMIRAAVHTGNCELTITASQGEASTTRTLTYNVAK